MLLTDEPDDAELEREGAIDGGARDEPQNVEL